LLSIGCRPALDARFDRSYEEARKKLWGGYFADAFQLADQNYQKSVGQSAAWSWKFQTLKARALLFQGKASEALPLLTPEIPSDLPTEVRSRKLIVQADALCRLGRRQEAATILEGASRLIAGNDNRLQAEIELTQGRCATDDDTAKNHFAAAASLAHGRDEFLEATGLLNLGFVLLREERYEDAIDELLKGVSVTSSPLLRERMLGNLAECYAALGDWRQSISYAEQAEKLAQQIQDTGFQETWLIDLGRANFALWEFPEAETGYLQALAIAQQRHDQEKVALCFHNLALLALRRQMIDQAEDYRRQGTALNVDRERFHFALDAAEIAAARQQWPEAERLFLELMPRTAEDPILHSMIQRELGKVCGKEGKIAQAHEMFRAGIEIAEKAVAKLKRPEYRMSFMDQDPFYDSYIQFLVEQNQRENALRIAERSRAQVLAAALETGKAREPLLSLRALKALSKERGQIILVYSMTDEESFLWVITPSAFELFHLPGHSALFWQVDAFNHEIQSHRTIAGSPAGQKLYQSLIQPAEKLIPNGSSVVIVPSKWLSMVNFEALIVPGPAPHYWIDDVNVQVTGSLALFTKSNPGSRKRQPGTKQLLALGAPVQASPDFPTLKHAAEEMQKVEGHFPSQQATVISGPGATPEAYRSSNPGQYRFLYLDTHAVASDLSPLESAVILSPGKNNTYKLLASDIKDIPLHADLVTISACYGAGTRWYQGEGLVGLAWAFLRAGAHQVVGALWEVDEASSPQLMDDFYGGLANGESASEALRAAKRKMLHSQSSYSQPFYWATLQVYTGG
jgi:CHAT domain-containing protein